MSKKSCFEHGEFHKALLLFVLSSIEREGEREVHKRENESLRVCVCVRVCVRALFGERALLPFCEQRQAGRTRGKGTKRTLLFAWPATVEREPDQTPLLSSRKGFGIRLRCNQSSDGRTLPSLPTDPGCLHWGFVNAVIVREIVRDLRIIAAGIHARPWLFIFLPCCAYSPKVSPRVPL